MAHRPQVEVFVRLAFLEKHGKYSTMRMRLTLWSVGINLLALLLPLALLQVYDRILPNQSAGTAAVIFSAVAAALVLSGFLRAVRARAFSKISATSDYSNWVTIAQGFLARDVPPDRARELMDVPLKARDAEAGQGMVALYDAPFAVVFLALIWFLAGPVVLAPLLAIGVATSLMLLHRATDATAQVAASKENAALRVAVSEFTDTSDGSGALLRTGGFFVQLGQRLRIRAKALAASDAAGGRQMDLMQTAGLATTVLVVGFGAAQVLSGEMTTGGLAACTLLGSRAASQSLGAIFALSRRGVTKNAMVQIAEIGRSSTKPIENGRAFVAGILGLDTLDGGEVIVLDGASQSEEARALSLVTDALWSNQVPQDEAVLVSARPVFARGTILENLSRFQSTDEVRATKLSVQFGLDAMIGRLAQGYGTKVDRRATGGLSPGAVKRAAIVQALVGKPKVLLLERPGISLDADGRKALAAMLQDRGPDVAVVMTTSDDGLRAIATKIVPVSNILADEKAVA